MVRVRICCFCSWRRPGWTTTGCPAPNPARPEKAYMRHIAPGRGPHSALATGPTTIFSVLSAGSQGSHHLRIEDNNAEPNPSNFRAALAFPTPIRLWKPPARPIRRKKTRGRGRFRATNPPAGQARWPGGPAR